MTTDPFDRTVHAITAAGCEIVRYDRSSKWYLENSRYRQRVRISEAVRLACLPGSECQLGLSGGKLFDAAVKQQLGERV